ncbi:MAG: ArnT family glycosyltransferase, partial [Nitrospiraceae bacterium]
MLSIILPTFLTSLYVGINMSARLGGGNAVVLPLILYPTDVFHSIVTKGKGGIIVVAGWLTRIPWWTLLLVWSAINFWQAAQLELINDEAYYWMFSRFPDWGYFDHPPMVAWWITLGTWAGGELGVRLASVIFWTLGGWLFVQLAQPAPATAAVLWYALLPLSSFSSFLALPDAPLCFFTLAFLYALERDLRENTRLSGAAVAVTAAGLLYSKYHGLLI